MVVPPPLLSHATMNAPASSVKTSVVPKDSLKVVMVSFIQENLVLCFVSSIKLTLKLQVILNQKPFKLMI